MTIVDHQLKLLISLYEEEQYRLQIMIDECLVETEYLMAHYHSQALHQINGALQTLKNIDDRLFDEKDWRQRMIGRLEKSIEDEVLDFKRDLYVQMLQTAKDELGELQLTPRIETIPGNESLFDETLKKLLDKKIKNLKLILKRVDNLFLGFSYSKRVLKVTMPYVKQHTKKWILNDYKIQSFVNIGFQMTERETKLVLILTGDKEDIQNRLKLILSKIVFEIFYFKDFANESYIEFTDKVSR